MSFSISARTLLELGKELISSDDVAIYELIKNSVDAKSSHVDLTVQVVTPAKKYRTEIENLNDGHSPSDVLKSLLAAVPSDVPIAILDKFRSELLPHVGNRAAFKAQLEQSYQALNWIEVRDSGHGMSLEDLKTIYLRIGTRSRRASNDEGDARYLGDKGVGRLSAMRLGDHLNVTTTQAGSPTWAELDIPWDRFSHDSDEDLAEVSINPRSGAKKSDSSAHGTVIRISKLVADWTKDKFAEMVSARISRLVDPFEPGRANHLLKIYFNGQRLLVESIPKSLLDAAHATCHARFYFDERGEPVLEAELDYALRNKPRKIVQRGAEVNSIAQTVFKRRGKRGNAAVTAVAISPKALRALGGFSCDIYWYNRAVVDAIADLTETKLQTRRQIAKWSGGPMLFRHGYRVLPYGDPDDDWLSLDRDAFSSSGFKLNRQQVIGRVNIRSSHKALSEQTNREGLVQSEESDALRVMIMWLLNVELRQLINDADKDEQLSVRTAEAATLNLRATQDEVRKSLEALRGRVSKDDKEYLEKLEREVNSLAGQCSALVSRLDKAVTEAAEDREKFVHLAGIGLITEFIFHELDRSVSYTLKTLLDAQKSGREAVLSSLAEQLKTLQKRVSQFDDLTGEKRQTKSSCNIREVVDLVLEGHANEFERHDIKLTIEGPASAWNLKAVKGMLIQILENLISNAVYWLKQQFSYEPGFEPHITVRIDDRAQTLCVFDNGPGVAPERQEVIFQPFISSKPAGQGRGLGLYISREMAQYHGWALEMDEVVGRCRHGRLNGFVLDFKGEQ